MIRHLDGGCPTLGVQEIPYGDKGLHRSESATGIAY